MKRMMSVALAAVLAAACLAVPAAGASDGQNDAAVLVAGSSDLQPQGVVSSLPDMVAQSQAAADYSWYDSSAGSFTLTNDGAGKNIANKLFGLIDIVNGTAPADLGIDADSFAGKSITLDAGQGQAIVNFLGNEWTPIGTAEHPFEGTFDGAGFELTNFKVTALHQDAGFFGVTGRSSTLRHIRITSGTNGGVVLGTESEPYTQGVIARVGTLAGDCNGRIEDCASSMGFTAVNNSDVTDDRPIIVDSIGGLVGRCRGGLSGSSYSGTMYVYSASSTSNANDQGYLIMQCIGGVVGFFGDIDAPTSTIAQVAGCANHGSVRVNTGGYSEAGDRFGEAVVAQAGYVGGVAGYSTGNVVDCVNAGPVDTSYRMTTVIYGTDIGAAGSYMGGIVGSLRGDTVEGMTGLPEGAFDAGTAGASHPVYALRCSNTGTVFGNHAVGGVVGETGWYASVVGCWCDIPVGTADKDDPDYLIKVGGVKAARWNKPMGGGIVGKSYGNIAYCYNRSRVWSTTDGGYYIAGIVGVMFKGTSIAGYPSPVPETWACYNTGYAQSGLRAASIAGQNEGFIHDCYALPETSYHAPDATEKLVFSQYATVARCDFLEVDEMKSASGVGKLNYQAPSEGWGTFFVPAGDSSNDGFPVLNWQDSGPKTDLSQLSGRLAVTLARDADYTGAEAVPTLRVLYDDDDDAATDPVELVQNADFKVVPEPGATAATLEVDRVTGTRPYTATIVGVGRYEGSPSNSASYGIVQGDLSSCTFIIPEKVYTGQPVYLDKSEVTLVGASGNIVPQESYDIVVNGGSECVRRGTYAVTATVVGGSDAGDYVGTLTAKAFTIAPADLHADCTVVSVSANGQTYGSGELGAMEFTYTGSPIKPTVDAVTYQPEGAPLVTLVEGASATSAGADYAVSYLSDGSYTDVTTGEGGERRNLTIESCWADTSGNFHNYVTLYFDIAPADISTASITVPDQARTGSPRGMALLEFNDATLVEGVDYQVSYSNNVNVGTATATITGIGNFSGIVTRNYRILDQAPIDIEENAQIAAIPDQGWTGKELKPAVQVTLKSGGAALRPGVDYVTTYQDNVNAGVATATVVGCGIYDGELSQTFNIVAHDVSFALGFGRFPGDHYAAVHIDGVRVIMNGGVSTKPAFPRGAGALVTVEVVRSTGFNRDCNLTGLAIVGDSSGRSYEPLSTVVSNDSSASGANRMTCTFSVPDEDITLESVEYVQATADLAGCTYEVGVQDYTGSPVVPGDLIVRDGDAMLERGVDYDVATYNYAHNDTEAGPASITLVGRGRYSGALAVAFEIRPAGELEVQAADVSAVFDGEGYGVIAQANIASAEVLYGRSPDACTLANSPRFVDAGVYTVYFVATSPGDYAAGQATVTIAQRQATVRANADSKEVGGDDPVFTAELENVLPADVGSIAFEVTRPGAGTDEAVGVYADAIVPAGAASQGNYIVSYVSADFTINAKDMLRVSASNVKATFDGEPHKLGPASTTVAGATVTYGLSQEDCALPSSPEFVDAGTYTVFLKATLTGYADAYGQATVTIDPAPLTLAADEASRVYGDDNPTSAALSATVTGLVGDDVLVKGADYTVSVVGVAATAAVGSYADAVRVSLNRDLPNYAVTLKGAALTVTPRSFASAVVSTLLDRAYTGSAITPVPDVTYDGKRMAHGIDFTVAYYDAAGNVVTPVEPGTYAVRVSGAGNYTGTATQATSFTIMADRVTVYRVYHTTDGEHFYTTSRQERDIILSWGGWNDEGIAWVVPSTSSTPVYRLYDRNTGEHHYTTSAEERAIVLSWGNWNDEGIAWYSDDAQTMPIHRLQNSSSYPHAHHYTLSDNEKSRCINEWGWRSEGIGWYALAAG